MSKSNNASVYQIPKSRSLNAVPGMTNNEIHFQRTDDAMLIEFCCSLNATCVFGSFVLLFPQLHFRSPGHTRLLGRGRRKERVRRQDELERKVDVFHLKDPPDERC